MGRQAQVCYFCAEHEHKVRIVQWSGSPSNMNIADDRQHMYLQYISDNDFSDTLMQVCKVIMIKMSIKWKLPRYQQ